MASDVEKLCILVSCLGGPSYTPDEFEWTTNIAAGRALIEWIASQLPSNVVDDERAARAALSRIALEDEEVKMLQSTRTKSDLRVDLSNYISPSRKSSQTALIDNSAYTLENEVLLLQHRLKQTKIVSQQLQKTAQAIKSELERVNVDIDEKQEELEQLSLQADSVVSSTRLQAVDVSKCLQENLRPDAASAIMRNCLDDRIQVTQCITEQLASIDAWKDPFPSAKELKLEALRLQNALGLDRAGNSSLLSSAEETAHYLQLKLLIKSLEEVNGDDGEIYDILQEIGIVNDRPSRTPNIAKELESAWNMDQSTILKARASVLDKASLQFHQTILPPLQDLNTLLEEQQSVLRETLSILGAFGQELDNIARDLEAVKTDNPPSSDDDRPPLEHELNALLKELQALRPSDSPPLVLLDQNDVLTELDALKQREKSLEVQEEQWCSSMPAALNSLMSMHAPALSATYAHSAVNTSLPYELSPSVTMLQRDAKVKSNALASEVQRLQKELTIMEDARTQRKLKSFVERWNSLSK